jgi:hypothetical protein
MPQAEIAEFAHAQLVDRLVRPSPLGTRLAFASVDRVFLCYFHCGARMGSMDAVASWRKLRRYRFGNCTLVINRAEGNHTGGGTLALYKGNFMTAR